MVYINIKKNKCTKCGICIEECPANVLILGNDSSEILNFGLCISCGHCAAICPECAISSSKSNDRNPFVIKKLPQDIAPEIFLFHKKRSVRNFKDWRLGKKQFKKLIEYGEKAPSSHNLRNRKYIVITNDDDINIIKDKIIGTYKNLLRKLNLFVLKIISFLNKPAHKELSELVLSFENIINEYNEGKDPVFHDSKNIICIAAPSGSVHSRDDCIAAQQYMMLYGKAVNIDSFIAGYAQYAHGEIEKYLNLDKGLTIFAISVFGEGKHEYSNEINYGDPEIIWKW